MAALSQHVAGEGRVSVPDSGGDAVNKLAPQGVMAAMAAQVIWADHRAITALMKN